MNQKLTADDLEKVRDIEGFPDGADEDIAALSDPPNFTACPNPFIEKFIGEHGTPYDEAADNYSREPFAADVSEGKNEPIYNAHSYHTKVPYKAIMRYILHYTKPGDIVFDGFCGTGMTGVAAQMCGADDKALEFEFTGKQDSDNWGKRFAILSDLSPAAAFIASVYNSPVDVEKFAAEFEKIFDEVQSEFGWMFTTEDEHGNIFPVNYVVWSDVLICPNCGEEFIFWNVAVDKSGSVKKIFHCPKCNAELSKNKCARAQETFFDSAVEETVTAAKQVPVMINYLVGKKQIKKSPDTYDFELLDKINALEIPAWFPKNFLPDGYNTQQPIRSHGVDRVYKFYTKRTLIILAALFNKVDTFRLRIILQSISPFLASRLVRYNLGHRGNGVLSGTLYLPSLFAESNVFRSLRKKFSDFLKSFKATKNFESAIISCQSLTDLKNVPKNSVDYIFTDPPFGNNLMYSELNFIWEAWLKVFTDNKFEAIINPVQRKELIDYQNLMTRSFSECYRILKPNRWLTVEFHNSKNAVWNAIQESLQISGFVIADVRTLDKQQWSFKQVTTTSAVKQDLIISAYKPREKLLQEFYNRAGETETAWLFVREHLKNLPTVIKRGQKLETVSERQKFLLFDRMVAFHLMQGLPVPISAAEFYRGLEEKFIRRDEMYFLPSQANEYDAERIACDLEQENFSLFIIDEKTAIDWINRQLRAERQTYQALQPKFMQVPQVLKKGEKIPELATLLEENFLRDDAGKWYIPDPKKIGDVEKLREKNLIREFEEYQKSSGALKIFRSEAIRAGFAKLYREKNFSAIVEMAERLPEEILIEDGTLSMYVDLSRQYE